MAYSAHNSFTQFLLLRLEVLALTSSSPVGGGGVRQALFMGDPETIWHISQPENEV